MCVRLSYARRACTHYVCRCMYSIDMHLVDMHTYILMYINAHLTHVLESHVSSSTKLLFNFFLSKVIRKIVANTYCYKNHNLCKSNDLTWRYG